eukprot:CAMPEP_0113881864 /NCGR_PEP_ID=MMETSP0780_2-20120614/8621_1 /TAXON_ID=652834 /ORGANISM="Palpitomonas bilix" /LENGTH=338 /DNA_ID=CAMNT_0000868785 /DNA_START=132 /DNA_END=1148 /DNA_ORIENTATION=- /assembly_acc=CAM_ASM_000599
MRAVVAAGKGGPEVLSWGKAAMPVPSPSQYLLKIKATAINRADTLQREGNYPVPKGASQILGLEGVGEVVSVPAETDGKDGVKVGDKVMALLSGGGNAEYCVADSGCVMPMPAGMTFTDAAAIPEVWLTAFQLLHTIAKVKEGDHVLIHAGASGVGTAAVQLCRYFKAVPFVTASSDEKIDFCKQLGAEAGINYKTGPPFGTAIHELTGGKGADIILDPVGASYFEQNLQASAVDARWVLFAFMGGGNVKDVSGKGINISAILRKRIQITGTTLRSRTNEYKSDLVHDFSKLVLPGFESVELKPIIDRVMSIEEIAEAHRYMAQNANKGKIVLTVPDE